MSLNIIELEKEIQELIRKPAKSKQEVELQQELAASLEKALNDEVAPLLDDLNGIGVRVISIWDLVNTDDKYPNAIPILLTHLIKDYCAKTKEAIIRALAVKEAIGKVSPILLDECSKITKDDTSLRWAIGNTIYVTITKDDVERIFSIVQDKENGLSRQMFVAALGKIKSEKVEEVLIKLLDDEEVTLHALEALGRMKSKKARDKVLILTKHSNVLIRKEAQKALKKL